MSCEVVTWREDQRQDRKALVQWYLVLISSSLRAWQHWCQTRKHKKQRQADAQQLFVAKARRWALAALLSCHQERCQAAQQERCQVQRALHADGLQRRFLI
eukprot:g11636.t1